MSRKNDVGKHEAQSTFLPSSEEELRQAIKSLEASTNAIEQQIALLKSQHASISALSRESASQSRKFEASSGALQTRWMHESQHTGIVTEELSSDISSMLRGLDEHVASSIRTVNPLVTAQLKKHDRVLDQLNVLGSTSPIAVRDERFTEERIEKLAAILAKFTEDEIRTRLNRIYLEGVASASNEYTNDAIEEDVDAAIAGIDASISPLQSEIADVATMCTQHVYRDPALLALRISDHDAVSKAHLRQDQILSTLSHLTEDTASMTDRLLEFESFRKALREIQSISLQNSLNPSKPSSPTKSSAAILPRSQRDPPSLLTSHPSLLTLLQNLGLPIPSSTDPSKLPSLLKSHATNHATFSASTDTIHDVFFPTLQSHLSNSRTALERIGEAVEQDDLTRDAAIMQRVDDLSVRVGETGRDVELMARKVEGVGREGDKARDEFVRRWGSGST